MKIVLYLYQQKIINHLNKHIMYTPTHYGKKINQLTDKETELLKIDMVMSLMFNKVKHIENEIEKKMLLSVSSLMSDKRVELCSELLNHELHEDDTEEFMDFVETTQYGYGKFLRDVDHNTEVSKTNERLSMLN